MAFHFGEVLLVPVVFSEGSEDLRLNDWREAGLRLPSTARMAKLATVSKTTIIRRLGQLTGHDLAQATDLLQQFFRKIS